VLFDQVRGQVERLIPLFGVSRHASDILTSFDTLCAESLNIDVRRRAPEFSRINADGTPFQFSLSLGRDRSAPLQFLGEAGRQGCSMEERRRASFASLEGLARACGVIEEVERITPTLCRLVPERHQELLAVTSGIVWFALSFSPDAAPSLTVYVNGRWGTEAAQRQRLDEFAAAFDSADRWRDIASLASARLSPLGMAFTLRPGRATSGRVYLQAFGEPLSAYRTLFLASTEPGAAEAFEEFGRHVLRDEARYPTRSAVFSIELPAARVRGAKFELCAHCAFTHDAEAGRRISGWLQQLGVNDEIYHSTVSTLNFGHRLSDRALPSLHAYVGVGARGSEPYASVYLNPGPALERM
jgi:hypothetical protein